MSKKTIELFNRVFEVEKPVDHIPSVNPYAYDYDEIYNVYQNPSISKVNIWHSWIEWVDLLRTQDYIASIEISSHTCMFFSISGVIAFPDGRRAYIWITYAHNRIYFENEA